MGQLIRAPWGCGVDSIDCEHEHLHILMNLAERSAVHDDRRHCRQMLEQALVFLETHARDEEHLLTGRGYKRIIEVRRGHERLILSLEQALATVEGKERGDLIDEIRRITDFLTDSAHSEALALRRFFGQPARPSHGTLLAAE
jgi:hemerythrin